MGKIEEIKPKSKKQIKDDARDTESDISDDEDAIARESLMDRIKALEEIFPEHKRESIKESFGNGFSVAKRAFKLVGNALWVVGTTAMVTLIPIVYAMDQEQQLVQYEQEHLAAQQASQQVIYNYFSV